MIARVPWRLVGYILAAVLALAALNHFAGFVPFTPQWSARQAEAKAERLEGQVSTLEREATGNAEIGQAVERHYSRETIIREIASQAETEARDAPDATTPLSQERADRLRLNDQRVCLSAPAICADPDPAAGRPPALPPAGPAG
jgi:hypothetical protein